MAARKRLTAAGSRLALALLLGACTPEPGESPASESTGTSIEEDVHAGARARLHAWEQARREQLDFATLPAADGRFGADPYRVIALPDERFAVLLRGADRLLLLDRELELVATAATPHDPTDMLWRDDALWVVGTGEARVARYGATKLEPHSDVALPDAVAPRVLASVGARMLVADEGQPRLHVLELADEGRVSVTSQDYCHGPIALVVHEDLLLGNCLLEHRVRVDRFGDGAAALELPGIRHDGPIWSLTPGPDDLFALTGVEDRPLDRSDGAFGYIDSFVWLYALRREADGSASFERRASVNVSELGVVTPKWSRWRSDSVPTLVLAGYASAPVLELRFGEGVDAPPQRVTFMPGLPGTRDAVWLDDARLLAADPLLDRLLLLEPSAVAKHDVAPELADDRSFAERLGEVLVFTTAMAPRNVATDPVRVPRSGGGIEEDRRSRFTCETCHFEGRGDGRVHFTGREFEGQKIHAVSKTLQGLFNNRPHFSRALDRTSAEMVDNEFRVANKHSELDPWFSLTPQLVPWIEQLPGWPGGEIDGEQLRLALLQFLLRYTPPRNPAVRGREHFDTLEAEGARLFATHCESCHQARLVTDEPGTRVPFERWQPLIFSANTPIVWASEMYVQTGITPWVHPDGARVPSLRRSYLDWPYFTNGRADSLAAVLEGIRITAQGCDHQLGPAQAPARGLDEHERAAILAFLRLL